MSVYEGHGVTLHHADCLDVLRSLPDCSVDSVVCDPPYNLAFMGKAWDDHASAVGFQQWCELWAAECLRVLRPGGHLLAFGGTRTWHRLACAVEDAGFEVRDSIAWLYGSGFSKGGLLGNKAGLEWCECGPNPLDDGARRGRVGCPRCGGLDPAFRGFSTTLKPAFEPVVVARKPLTGTVAGNVLAWGTGALNVDGCRIAVDPDDPVNTAVWTSRPSTIRPGTQGFITSHADGERSAPRPPGLGRWPANVVLDETQAEALDEQSGERPGFSTQRDAKDSEPGSSWLGTRKGDTRAGEIREGYNDTGGASRFFYVAKADASERPRLPKRSLRLRDDLTPEQVDHVRARLVEAGVQVD